MANLNEYKIEIKNDEDLAKWKAVWNGIGPIPEEVHHYMRTVVLPRITEKNANILLSLGIVE
jgi:hypothetical protein